MPLPSASSNARFADDPKLAEDLASSNRYNAACYATLAASGQGVDAPTAPADRAALRGKALSLAPRRPRRADRSRPPPTSRPSGMAAYRKMRNGWTDADFATVRPGDPKYDLLADERPAWESLWADVRATLEAASKPVQAVGSNPKP